MTKVFPNIGSALPIDHSNGGKVDGDPMVLTVWKKSLILNCDGYTVFDASGNLVYRVDNYRSRNKAEIFLMDALGNTLLTVRRKRMSLGDTWSVFDGDTTDNPKYLVKKNVNLLKTKSLAHVTSLRNQDAMPSYEIEGSYAQRCCAVYDVNRRLVAEIKRKEHSIKGVDFGTDIFRLVVQPGFKMEVAMAMVILLDQMYGSSISPRRRRSTNSFS